MRALRLLQAENALKRKCIAENARRWVGRPLTEKHARVDDGDVTTQRCYAGLAADDRLGTTGGSCLPATASPAIACTPSLLELTVPLTGPSFSALDGGHRDGAVSAADPPSAPFPFTTAAQATTSPALGSCPVQPRTVVSPASVHRSGSMIDLARAAIFMLLPRKPGAHLVRRAGQLFVYVCLTYACVYTWHASATVCVFVGE